MRDTIDMAREAGAQEYGPLTRNWSFELTQLKAFEAFVRADEQEKYKWDIHSCGPTCNRYACVAMREAVEAEREACAKVCETKMGPTATDYYGKTYAAAIRARGNT